MVGETGDGPDRPARPDPGPAAGPTPYTTTQGLPPPATHPFGSAESQHVPSRSWGTGEPRGTGEQEAPGRPLAPPTGWQPAPGWEPAPRPPARPEDVASARRLGRLGIYTAVMGVVCSLVFFPVGFVIDIVAIVLGIRARRRAVAAGISEGSGVVSVVLGAVGLSLAIVLAAVVAVFWTEIRDYRSCASGANTHAASADCEAALRDDLMRRVGVG